MATDNYKGGALGAERLATLLGGKGNVILLRYAVGSASTEARENGFLDTLKAKYPDIKIISADQYAGATRETAYQASQNLLNRHGREVNGIFCVNENSTVGMTKALRTIPVILKIAEDMHELGAPGAMLVNFTNPAGLVTQALSKYAPDVPAVGVCNVPITAKMMILEWMSKATNRALPLLLVDTFVRC